MAEPIEELPSRKITWQIPALNIFYILAALFIFLFALDLMISTLEHLGRDIAETIILATSNPFTGLFIGILITAIIQSSSAVTSITVALVASGAMTLEGAVPIIMGANIGTTITSALVSIGFITKKKEFRRAVAAGTYHSFFNILTAAVLFPLEYYNGFLSKLSQFLATAFFGEPIGSVKADFSFLGSGLKPVISFLIKHIDSGAILIVISVALIFGSILFFRKVLSALLNVSSQESVQRFFFKSSIKSFAWGIGITAAIRSSTVTTSLVVPLVAKKIIKLKSAVPFILGANIGTTITAFIAAMFNSNAAISIAIAHFLFNLIGVLIFFPIPYLRAIPVNLSTGLGELTRRYRLVGFLYLLLTFFFIPFTLIYLNKSAVDIQELTYVHRDKAGAESKYKVIVKIQKTSKISGWKEQETAYDENETFSKVTSVYLKNNLIMINRQVFEFNVPGRCRSGNDSGGQYHLCVKEIIGHLALNPAVVFDSVYVYEKQYDSPRGEQFPTWYYISQKKSLLLKKEKRSETGEILASDALISLEKRK